MVRCSNLLGLLSCFILASSSGTYERLSDSRRLTLLDKTSGKLILYEFEDLDRDGNVEICVSGDPERKIKAYAYFSKKHADKINKFTGVSIKCFTGYSSKDSHSPSINAEVIIMSEEEQKRANYLFTFAN